MELRPLIEKYSVSGPRYTSYPTAPQWTEEVSAPVYREILSRTNPALSFDPQAGFSLYVHLPFCESLCYYCGCNVQITKSHDRSQKYVDAVVVELAEVGKLLGKRFALDQVAWGGGTPTFLTIDQIRSVYGAIAQTFSFSEAAEISVEIDPRVTSEEQLRVMRELGFNRVSLGVQDFDLQVQKAVNRVQSVEMTEKMLTFCRDLGYRGINFDFIYGLPFQTLESFQKTVKEIIRIRPDRIALYNYAHLPSLRPHQKILEKFPLPEAEERTDIFLMAYDALLGAGYRAIGMDHFALETDEIFRALEEGYLSRNFQGYTVRKGANLIGVGASAIGEVGSSYFQNVREPKYYEERVGSDGIATMRGFLLRDTDRARKWVIQNLMCRLVLSFADFRQRFGRDFSATYARELSELKPFVDEGILQLSPDAIRVTQLGRLFVRNVAMVFDEYLRVPSKAIYSKTV